MKWVPALASCTLAVLLISGWTLTDYAETAETHIDGVNVQLGFYDLLSQRKEIYNTKLQNKNGTIITSITNPDDNHFLVKGKLVNISQNSNEISLEYKSIYYSDNPSINSRMIDNVLDYYTHNKTLLQLEDVKGQNLIMAQTGLIFVDKPPKHPSN